MNITKQLFVETISSIKEQFEHDKKCHEAFSTILKNDFVSNYDHSLVLDSLINILKKTTGDNFKESWIEYYIYMT